MSNEEMKGGVKSKPKVKPRNTLLRLNRNPPPIPNISYPTNTGVPSVLHPVPEEKSSSHNSVMDELAALFGKMVKIPKSRKPKVKGSITATRKSTRIASIPVGMNMEYEVLPTKTKTKTKTAKTTKTKKERSVTDPNTITTAKLLSKLKSMPFPLKLNVERQLQQLDKYFGIIDNKLRILQQKAFSPSGLTAQDKEDLAVLRKFDANLKAHLIEKLKAGNIAGTSDSYYEIVKRLSSKAEGMQEGGKKKKTK